jgi:CheY-like chemotaxis protein
MNRDEVGSDIPHKKPQDQPDLLSHFRHEVHTPLNAIIGYSEMLLEVAEESPLSDFPSRLQEIRATGNNLLSIAGYVLNPTRTAAVRESEVLIGIANEIRARLAGPLSALIDSSEHLARDAAAAGQAEAAADLRRIHIAGERLQQFLRDTAKPGALSSIGAAPERHLPAATPTVLMSAERTLTVGALDEPGSVLVVDDNEMNRDLLSRILLRRGHQVALASDGREALAMLGEQPFDLVLLDILMPELNGYEVLEHLKASPASDGRPVIFISAFDDLPEKLKAFQAGAVDYITKPFQAEEVLARAENQLKIIRLQRRLHEQNQDLLRKNAELVQAQKRTDKVFSALADALPGAVLDQKYRLEEKIGSGGFGAVFRATHLSLRRPVAVKVFRPMRGNDSPDALRRFRLEGASASRVNHPNAVAVLDSGISEAGIAYIVMELLNGHSLRDELQLHGAMPPSRVIEIALPVCRVLAEAHAGGIVHRDIKPDNIFLHQAKEGEVVKVVDFGLAKIFGEEADSAAAHTMTGGIVGTPAYLSPERVNSDIYDGRADVYSLGIIMFQMLTGRAPFEANEGGAMALLVMHVMKEPPRLRDLNPAVPPEFEALVLEMLRKDPRARPDAQQIAQQLAAWQQPVSDQ